MKKPTVFLIDLVDELNTVCWCNDLTIRFTVDTLDGRELTRAFDIVQDDKIRLEYDLDEIRDNYDPTDYNEVMQSIAINNKLFTDLCLLQELMVNDDVDYTSPQNLPKTIKTIAELLAKQLECKAEFNPFYDEYYCKQLTNVLAELCSIAKEGK